MADWVSPVRLEYATSQDFSSGAASFTGSFVRVKVDNLAFEKIVKLHYRAATGWQEVELPWTAGYGSHDIFSARVPYMNEFAISYTANNITYWDNNDFQNYSVPNFHSAVGGHVMLRRATLAAYASYQRSMSGVIYVENMSYNKRVGVRALPFGGSTWLDLGAHYIGLANEDSEVSLGPVEQWEYGSPIVNTSGFTFAAYYQNLDTGEWSWDNNFGRDYAIFVSEIE